MWKPWELGLRSNARAVENARLATTLCSRRRLEQVEVELYLAARVSSYGARVPARSATGG
ncbi:hypothetical protein [Nocardioides sp. cx-173]|uniref:hypothetical protein n=1 Tax=Nocardioides sp. cx-173 TaxID=2898796 RepID=UPI001E46E86A|nr:hypothetical protein [Nocardioides sp. cx-173]MCD4526385.1 hypothetical protein [Nocardioides sp. cx-173]UGB43557.1 hypothetical protein LQ940_08520 [Nocardioides sp. cx-173]